ncbi:host attachment protein [Bordetella sp. FB-8]|uniref:host attachment protein n=1 Tax=Bordetella sp. FB-8 TaxID=1159870 RepID=UPI00036053E3|nr:host attachment protein [Bordetella sp. FB-8]
MSFKIPNLAWIAVCDGAKGIVFRNEGERGSLNLCTVSVMGAELRAAHEHGSDRPDRIVSPTGSGRHAVETVDRHRLAEIHFLEDFARSLDDMVPQHALQATLIVIAPPRALGILRRKLSARLRQMLKREIARDLTGHTVDQIETFLSIPD